MLLEKLKYTDTVIKWFNDISTKDNSKFFQMDIKDFYPSITEETLDAAIVFEQTNTNISNEDIRRIKYLEI